MEVCVETLILEEWTKIIRLTMRGEIQMRMKSLMTSSCFFYNLSCRHNDSTFASSRFSKFKPSTNSIPDKVLAKIMNNLHTEQNSVFLKSMLALKNREIIVYKD